MVFKGAGVKDWLLRFTLIYIDLHDCPQPCYLTIECQKYHFFFEYSNGLPHLLEFTWSSDFGGIWKRKPVIRGTIELLGLNSPFTSSDVVDITDCGGCWLSVLRLARDSLTPFSHRFQQDLLCHKGLFTLRQLS